VAHGEKPSTVNNIPVKSSSRTASRVSNFSPAGISYQLQFKTGDQHVAACLPFGKTWQLLAQSVRRFELKSVSIRL
jgi:hypothetical protein